jgi:hypothetical protein
MEIPDYLESQTREGRVVLFLGAGASAAATNSRGEHPPTAARLGEMLADKFLGGKYRTHPLNQIAEYAISESDLGAIQSFIRDEFEKYEPSPAHLLIPRFWWYGLATTNYDRLIEKAYTSADSSLQEIRPLIENTDRIDDNLRQARNVLLLKLHGCVTRSSNPSCQMILTVDQYVEHRKGRDRLFATLQTWAYGKGKILGMFRLALRRCASSGGST